MAYSVTITDDAHRDIEAVFQFLVESYSGFGEPTAEAFQNAALRIDGIYEDAERIGAAPFRGTLHREFSPPVRHVTIDRAIFWFDVHETERNVRILGVFFGGQDHEGRMFSRLVGD